MKKYYYLAKEGSVCPVCSTPIPDGEQKCPNPGCPSNTTPPVL